jgi:glycosyltransferase involved in cell wall biosynthesis
MIEFVVPDLGGRPTGGTRYNTRWIEELRRLGVSLVVCSPDDVRDAEFVLVDSLYLDRVPAIRRTCRTARVGVVLHYLPSLVEFDLDPVALSDVESAALAATDVVVVPSEFMAGVVARAGFADRRIFVLEPGTDVTPPPRAPDTDAGVRALVVGHVVPNKRIEPLLGALADASFDEGRFSLRIAGDLAADGEYSARCRAVVAKSPRLSRSVAFLGNLEPDAVTAELGAANLALSASRMESYGMALYDARAAGVPIAACAGGNVAQHVTPEWGGELVADESALAEVCLRLASDADELCARVVRARTNPPPPRRWDVVAREFLSAMSHAGINVDRTNAGTSA